MPLSAQISPRLSLLTRILFDLEQERTADATGLRIGGGPVEQESRDDLEFMSLSVVEESCPDRFSLERGFPVA